jgi:hypothetical protein
MGIALMRWLPEKDLVKYRWSLVADGTVFEESGKNATSAT